MATLPIHTVQHIKSVYNKFQVIAVFFTAVTLLAALLAAVSGFQLAKLRKMQPTEVQLPETPAVEPSPTDSGLEKKIKALEDQLQSEQTTSKALRAKVQELEANIAALKVVTPTPARPVAEKPIAPAKPKVPVKPKVSEVAPDTGTPPPTKNTEEGKTVVVPPKTSSPPIPAAASEPAAPPIPDKKTEPPVTVEKPAPHTEIAPSEKPSEQMESSVSPTPVQTGAPAMEQTDRSEAGSVTKSSPDSLPAQPSGSEVSNDDTQKTAPSQSGDTGEAPGDTMPQPGSDSKGESRTD
jgi:hypothetical protein